MEIYSRLWDPQKLKLWLSNITSPWKTQCQRTLVWTISVKIRSEKVQVGRKWNSEEDLIGRCGLIWTLKSGHHLDREEREGHLRQEGNSKDSEWGMNIVWRTGRKWGSWNVGWSIRWGWMSKTVPKKERP